MANVHVSIVVITSKEDGRIVGTCSLEHNGYDVPQEITVFADAMRQCDGCRVSVMTAEVAEGSAAAGGDITTLLDDITRRN